MSLTMLAILPSIILMVYIYKKDNKEKEPVRFLLACFGFGALTALPAVLLETIESVVVDAVFTEGSVIYAIVDSFLVAAFSEELFKYLFLKIKTWKSWQFNCTFDGVVYAVFVSLGFATLENILYVAEGGLSTAILRMFTSIPGHMAFGVFMGYYYSFAKSCELWGNPASSSKHKKRALWVPVLLHGIYDTLLSVDAEVAGDGWWILSVILWFVFIIVMYVMTFKLVNKASKYDHYFFETVAAQD